MTLASAKLVSAANDNDQNEIMEAANSMRKQTHTHAQTRTHKHTRAHSPRLAPVYIHAHAHSHAPTLKLTHKQSTRAVTLASAKLVSAANANDQNEIMEAANSTRKSIVDLVHTGKGAAENAEEVCGESPPLPCSVCLAVCVSLSLLSLLFSSFSVSGKNTSRVPTRVCMHSVALTR